MRYLKERKAARSVHLTSRKFVTVASIHLWDVIRLHILTREMLYHVDTQSSSYPPPGVDYTCKKFVSSTKNWESMRCKWKSPIVNLI